MIFTGRLAIQQRVLPAYRAPFFDTLALSCTGGLSIFAGQPLSEENILPAEGLAVARYVPAHNLHLFNPASPFYQCWQTGMLPWLEEWQPQALIVEANPRYHSTPRAVRWMHARQRPVLGWGLGAPLLKGRFAGWRQRSRQSFLRTLDGIIAYSQHGADEYRQMGIPAQRVFVAPNAAAPRPAWPLPQRSESSTGRLSILFVGRLQERKRIDLLLHACAALPNHLQPHLLIVGEGPDRLRLQALASQVYPAAEFCGAQHGPGLTPYFLQADLFVLPGTGGLAVQQAMAYGLPVVVAEGDGTQDDLVHPGNGWVVPPGDQKALASILAQALADLPRLRRMGRESYRLAKEEVNLEAMADAFFQALNAVL